MGRDRRGSLAKAEWLQKATHSMKLKLGGTSVRALARERVLYKALKGERGPTRLDSTKREELCQ